MREAPAQANKLQSRLDVLGCQLRLCEAIAAFAVLRETTPLSRPNKLNSQGDSMPKFVIERDISGAGKLSPAELKNISLKSCGVLSSLGPSVQWVHSYVTADKIYCIYHAADESLVR